MVVLSYLLLGTGITKPGKCGYRVNSWPGVGHSGWLYTGDQRHDDVYHYLSGCAQLFADPKHGLMATGDSYCLFHSVAGTDDILWRIFEPGRSIQSIIPVDGSNKLYTLAMDVFADATSASGMARQVVGLAR